MAKKTPKNKTNKTTGLVHQPGNAGSLSLEPLPKRLSILPVLSENPGSTTGVAQPDSRGHCQAGSGLGTPPPSGLFRRRITPKGIGKEGIDSCAQMQTSMTYNAGSLGDSWPGLAQTRDRPEGSYAEGRGGLACVVTVSFFFFLVAPSGPWDLSSPTRDQTWALGSESSES